jgi:hypothetical protein
MHTILLNSLRLDNSGVPIYVQLREQILRNLGAGLLKRGDQMPTMREVAVALKIDLNTRGTTILIPTRMVDSMNPAAAIGIVAGARALPA